VSPSRPAPLPGWGWSAPDTDRPRLAQENTVRSRRACVAVRCPGPRRLQLTPQSVDPGRARPTEVALGASPFDTKISCSCARPDLEFRKVRRVLRRAVEPPRECRGCPRRVPKTARNTNHKLRYMMVSTGPAARIPAEAPQHADAPLGTRGSRAKANRVRLRRASFYLCWSGTGVGFGQCTTLR
jgi:hypothetical protein